MSKEAFTPLTTEIIEQWTQAAIESAITERELLLERQLIPELRKELAVYEVQSAEIARMESEVDVMNLASEFVLRIKGGEFERAYQCFALNTPGVCAEITGLGVYEGPDALHSYYVDYLTAMASEAGYFKMNHLCTPVVEVAQDNQTARGMWLSVGMEALKRPDLTDYPDPLCLWAFNPWCMDFVKENGVWKIWHLYVFEEVETVYEKSWSETADGKVPADPAAPAPSRVSDRHHPFTADRLPTLHAEPPIPYAVYGNDTKF